MACDQEVVSSNPAYSSTDFVKNFKFFIIKNLFLVSAIEVQREQVQTLIEFKHRVDFLMRWQVDNNPWFCNHPDLQSKRVRIQTLKMQYVEAFAQHPAFRHWTVEDFSLCAFRLIEILHEVIMYQITVCRLFVNNY